MNYYNKETNKWNDEIIRESLLKISKGKSVKLADYKSIGNFEIIEVNNNFCFVENTKRNISKIIINTKLYGKLDRDFDFDISISNKDEEWFFIKIKKENGKKQYDGNTIFVVDINKEYIIEFLFISVLWGDDYININKVIIEYTENFQYYNYLSYKEAVLNDLTK